MEKERKVVARNLAITKAASRLSAGEKRKGIILTFIPPLRINLMNAEIMKVYVGAVAARVKMNGGTSWGGADSTAVIEALADAAYSTDEGFDPIRGLVGELVNPSAFRQKLEKLDVGNPCYVRPGEKGKRGGVSEALNALKSAGISA